jgi:hypothetical protein
MCSLCNGTHVVYEIHSFGYRTSCCPLCGPVPDEVWFARLEAFIEDIRTKKEAISSELCRG